MPGAKKDKKPHKPRNYELAPGVMRFSRARMFQKRGLYKTKPFKAVKQAKPKKELYKIKKIGGAKNGGERKVLIKKKPALLGPEYIRTRYPSRKLPFSKHKRTLRPSLKPGTVVILLAGRHKGKRAVFLKQLQSGLLLVTGPFKLNACPLRRINQCYVIATKTRLNIDTMKVPEHLNDQYFRRAKKPKKSSKAEADIFATKKEGYVLSDQRKKDQEDIDKKLLEAIKKREDKKMLFGYLGSTFSLQKNQYPHTMVF